MTSFRLSKLVQLRLPHLERPSSSSLHFRRIHLDSRVAEDINRLSPYPATGLYLVSKYEVIDIQYRYFHRAFTVCGVTSVAHEGLPTTSTELNELQHNTYITLLSSEFT